MANGEHDNDHQVTSCWSTSSTASEERALPVGRVQRPVASGRADAVREPRRDAAFFAGVCADLARGRGIDLDVQDRILGHLVGIRTDLVSLGAEIEGDKPRHADDRNYHQRGEHNLRRHGRRALLGRRPCAVRHRRVQLVRQPPR